MLFRVRAVAYALILSLLVLKLVLSYHFVPKSITVGFDAIIFLLCLFLFYIHSSVTGMIHLEIALLILICLLYTYTGFLYEIDGFKVFSANIRFVNAFVVYIVFRDLLSHSNRHTSAMILSVVGFFVIVLGILALPYNRNRGEVWFPSYIDNLHTSAYVFALCGVYLSYEFRSKPLIAVPVFVVVFFITSQGFGVRTASIMMLIYLLLVSYWWLIKSREVRLILYFSGFVSVSILAIFFFDFQAISEVSSGRLHMYVQKAHSLYDNGPLKLIVGNGSGSDVVVSEVWGTEGGSHSDWITFLYEGGLLNIGLIITLLSVIWKGLKTNPAKALFIGMLFTCTFSNGVLVRPSSAYLFFIFISRMNELPGTPKGREPGE